MLRSLLVSLISLFIVHLLSGQYHLVIAGNTADAGPEFYRALDERLAAIDGSRGVLLAGDFIPACFPAMLEYDPKEKRGDMIFHTVAPLVALARKHPDVEFYLVPGDRDWDWSGENGLKCVKKLQNYLENQFLDNLNWPLKNGCPGPELVELSDQASLLMVNSQWWNHPHDKPVPADADCLSADSEIVIDEILSLLKENRTRNMVLAGHYPPASQGRRGGAFPAGDHLVPPLLGSLLLSWKQNVGTPEELNNHRLDALTRAYRNNNSLYSGLFFVGAQDRSQQLLAIRNNHIINAGAAGPGEWVADHEPAIHVSRRAGFTELFFGADGAVNYAYWAAAASSSPAMRQQLYTAPCAPGQGEVPGSDKRIPPNPAFGPCNVTDEEIAMLCAAQLQDSVSVMPGRDYSRGKIGEFFLGKHYRTAWNTPVVVPVRTATELHGGLTPIRKGGGLQTKTLRFKAQDGSQYVFRSVDKYPRRGLDFDLRPTFVGDILDDQTTMGHPFGPLVVPALMDNLDILHVDSELFSLGNCPGLGRFNLEFGSKLGTLEEIPRGRKKKEGFAGTFGAKEVYKSYEAFRQRFDDQEVRFAHNEFLRARLFDLLIGDWNRHEDNWKWAEFEDNGIKILRPIPRDRDNAFSLIDGFGPKVAAKVFLSRLEHFGFKKPDAGSLSHQSRHLDRFILSPLSRKDYLKEAQFLQNALTDEIIEQAVRKMPAATFAVSGREIVAKLKARRDEILSFAEDLYVRYAETVDIIGTNDEEEFTIRTHEDNHVTVVVTDIKGRSAGKTLYKRTFYPWETREIRLYGLGDDDIFQLDGKAGGPINVRLIGGPGKDQYRSDISGKGEDAAVYERSKVGNSSEAPGFKFVDSYRDYLYSYDRTAHEFNKVRPAFGADFSGFNGLSLGVGLKYTRYNFKHRDYAAKYKLYFESNIQGNYLVEFTADVNDIWRSVDFMINTHYGVPDFYNFFFGIGNNTVFNRDEVERNTFHLVRLSNIRGEFGFRRPFAGRSYVSVMLGGQDNVPRDTEGTILETDEFFGEEDLFYAFVRPEFMLDLRDDANLPTKGILLEANHKTAFKGRGERFSVTRLAAEAHLTSRRSPITLSFRAGYAASTGRVPFYEMPALGRNNGLRGFQRRRFTGDGYVFYNTELRMPVAEIRSKLIPFSLGVRVFYDRGRLLMDTEENVPMKDSYGLGIFLVPISKKYTLSATAGFSVEEAPVIRLSSGVEF